MSNMYMWHKCKEEIKTSKEKTFTFMHLADAFIQSDLQYIQVIHMLSARA